MGAYDNGGGGGDDDNDGGVGDDDGDGDEDDDGVAATRPCEANLCVCIQQLAALALLTAGVVAVAVRSGHSAGHRPRSPQKNRHRIERKKQIDERRRKRTSVSMVLLLLVG